MSTKIENNGDASANTGTLYSISLEDIFQGTLDPADDKDWIRVELTAETIYEISLTSVESARLEILDSAGNHIVSGAENPTGSKLIFKPSITGAYFVHVGSKDNTFSGKYELSLVENTIPEGAYDEIADYLTDGFSEWLGSSRSAFYVEPGGILTANITVLTEKGQQLARWAFDAWTNVTGIRFEFVEDNHADIIFESQAGTNAHGGPVAIRNGLIISSTVNIPPEFLNKYGTTIDSFPFRTFVHEIGHALGLGHPGPYPTDFDSADAYYGIENIFLIDSWQASIMSYMHQTENTYINASFAYTVTPMIADIIAIQNLYGVPDSINPGDTVYGYQSNLDGYLGEFFRTWTGEENPFLFVNVDVADFISTPNIKPILSDLDTDGDLDLIIGSQSGTILYFENTGTTTNPNYTERIGPDNPLNSVTAGSFSEPASADLDGDSDLDLIIGNNLGKLYYFENIGTADNPSFTRRTGVTNSLEGVDVGSYSKPTLADLDNDGDFDLLVGNDGGGINYFENTGSPTDSDFTHRRGVNNPLEHIKADAHSATSLADLDGDGDIDLVIWGWYGTVKYFENTGTVDVPSFAERTGVGNPLDDISFGRYSIPTFVDLDDDSDLDLVIANRDGVIHYFMNIGTSSNPDFSATQFSRPVTLTLYDNSGNDTLDLRTDTNDQFVYLRPEGISDVYGLTGNLIIARGTLIENYIAGSGNDVIVGNAAVNYINGREGDDRIWGGDHDDILEGGAGSDRLDGGTGMDWVSYRDSDAAVTVNLADSTASGGHAEGDVLVLVENVIGSDHADVLTGNDEANRLEGGAGADQLDGSGGSDWVSYQGSDAGVTVDLAQGTFEGGHAQGDVVSNIENVVGSGHADVLRGDDNANRLEGGAGSDELGGGGGADMLDGGDGDDLLYGSAGADQLNGGTGHDVLTYQLSDAGVTINLVDGSLTGGDAQGDEIAGIERIIGSDHADVLLGDNGANELYGMGGADELRGYDGNDKLEGGAGADELDGGAGEDWLLYVESDAAVTVNLGDNTVSGGHALGDTIVNFENIAGSGHDDVLTGDDGANVLVGGAGADQLDGGAGVDWVSYQGSDQRVIVRLTQGTGEDGHAEGDVITNFENVNGTAYNDGLVGDSGANYLSGNGGNDGLWGSAGDDILEGGAGNDRLFGGAGMDTASYQSSDTGVTVNLKEGTSEGGHANGDTITDIENITGSIFKDVLVGDDGVNRLDGNKGDDELKGGIGNDQLYGKLGNDWLYGGDGDDELLGNEGNDRLFGENGVDSLYGGEDDDELYGGGNNDQLYGEMGEDVLYGDEGNDELIGGDGNDWLFGEAGADKLDGGSGIDWASYQESDAGVTVDLTEGTGEGGHAQGDDISNVEDLTGSDYKDILKGDGSANILLGLDGDDELRGHGGNDVLEGGAGSDQIDGGSGIDVVSYLNSDEGVTVDLAEGTVEGGHAEGDVLTSIENVIGSDHEDSITGDSNANHLDGGEGNDLLYGGAGADMLRGGAGSDWAGYQLSDAGVMVRLHDDTARGGEAEGDTFPGRVMVGYTDHEGNPQTVELPDIENLYGSDHADILAGDLRDNWLYGGAGNDELDGLEGNDVLFGEGNNDELDGGEGSDYLQGGAGADMLRGGAGSDWAGYRLSDAGVVVRLHDDTARGGEAEGDTFPGRVMVEYTDLEGNPQMVELPDIENLYGSDHGDILAGDLRDNRIWGIAGDDVLYGGPGGGDDMLRGGDGHDRLYGGMGSDTLEGGAGDDLLWDGPDNDRLYGNEGSDVFIFNVGHGNDRILDFTNGEDQIDLSAFNLSGFGDLTTSFESNTVTIDLSEHGGGTILLAEFDIADLDAADFLL